MAIMAIHSESTLRTFDRILYELREEHERALKACQNAEPLNVGEKPLNDSDDFQLGYVSKRSMPASMRRSSQGGKSVPSCSRFGSESSGRHRPSVHRLWDLAARSSHDLPSRDKSMRASEKDGVAAAKTDGLDIASPIVSPIGSPIGSPRLPGANGMTLKSSIKSKAIASGKSLASEATHIHVDTKISCEVGNVGSTCVDSHEVSEMGPPVARDKQHNRSGPPPTPTSPRKKQILNSTNSWSALGNEMQKVATLRNAYSADRPRISKATVDSAFGPTRVSSVEALNVMRQTKFFENICGSVIVFNCIVLGVLAQYSAKDHTYVDSPPMILDVLDKTCSVWFLIELLVRFSGGWHRFFCGSTQFWNIFDFVLVTVDVIDNGVQIIWGRAGSPVKNFVVLRALRIFRVMRIIRLLQFCRDLQMMLQSIRMCGKSLIWALVLVFLIIYLFAMYFMQQVTDYLIDSPNNDITDKLSDQWGSIFVSSYTLYMVMSGGVSWKEVSQPLLDMHWIHGLALFFYVFFTLFVVTNIITSIFVDTAIQSTAQDREEVIQKKLRERDILLAQMTNIFEEADEDGEGLISFQAFQRHMHDERVRAYLRSVDLDVTEAKSLFSLLDTDGSGSISITEFVFGCMRLKGAARSVDLAILMHDSRLLHELIDDVRETQLKQSWDIEGLLHEITSMHRRNTPESPKQEVKKKSLVQETTRNFPIFPLKL